MASYGAIATVSEALIDTLRTVMTEREDVISLDRSEIVLGSPDEVGTDSDTRLSLYLYKVERSPHQQQRPVIDDDTRRSPPLSIDLYYLLTAYPAGSGTDETSTVTDQHDTLGLAMQVLYDNSVLDGDDLDDSFRDGTEITLSMDSDAENRISRIWDSFREVPLYPSVAYSLGPVLIDSRREETVHRVTDREFRSKRSDR